MMIILNTWNNKIHVPVTTNQTNTPVESHDHPYKTLELPLGRAPLVDMVSVDTCSSRKRCCSALNHPEGRAQWGIGMGSSEKIQGFPWIIPNENGMIIPFFRNSSNHIVIILSTNNFLWIIPSFPMIRSREYHGIPMKNTSSGQLLGPLLRSPVLFFQ